MITDTLKTLTSQLSFFTIAPTYDLLIHLLN